MVSVPGEEVGDATRFTNFVCGNCLVHGRKGTIVHKLMPFHKYMPFGSECRTWSSSSERDLAACVQDSFNLGETVKLSLFFEGN
jgi:hypothetical protein